MGDRRRVTGVLLLALGLLLLGVAGWLYLEGCGPAGPSPMAGLATAPPTRASSPAPSARPAEVRLRVRCNGEVALRLLDGSGAEVHHGTCQPNHPALWTDVRAGVYTLEVTSSEVGLEERRQVEAVGVEEEVVVLVPGVLEVQPRPASAEVEIEGKVYRGPIRLTIPGESCPYTATVWVRAAGYQEDGRLIPVRAGRKTVAVLALLPLPTPTPTVEPTAVRPARTSLPTSVPFTVEERVALVRQRLYEKVNCWRAEAGLPPLPYIAEWQALADDFARGWRDHFLRYGVEGFDSSPWRQQFQAAGGDAFPDSAGLALYAPQYYSNTFPRTQWEVFDMCDPSCPLYHYFLERKPEILRASGVVIGLVPWWDWDILQGAAAIGFKW